MKINFFVVVFILFKCQVNAIRAVHHITNHTICGPNEVYSATGKTMCENTCKEPTKMTHCKAPCSPGCGCIQGFLRNDHHKCVDPADCGGCDGDPNAMFSQCGDPCPKTCSNMYKGDLACREECLQGGGCKCKPGYVRKIFQGNCVLPSECPKCGENEVFRAGSPCDTTCATLGEDCPIMNIRMEEKCYCVDGYARDVNNVCIPIKQCPPKKCPVNQVWNPCPPSCPPEKTCEAYMSGIVPDCTTDEVRICKPKCMCSPGLIRRVEGGDCIKPQMCCTDPNSELIDNPNCCPGGTCAHPQFMPCKRKCDPKGCQCKRGFLKRNDTDPTCIPARLCPKYIVR